MMKTRDLIVVAFLTVSGAVLASFVVPWRTLDGGGRLSTASAGGTTFTVTGTIGQFDAHEPATGGRFAVAGGYWSVGVVPAEGDAPRLQISQVSGLRVLSWPESAAGWILQKSVDLQQWHDVGSALTGAGLSSLGPPDTDQPKYFYRLRRP